MIPEEIKYISFKNPNLGLTGITPRIVAQRAFFSGWWALDGETYSESELEDVEYLVSAHPGGQK